MPDAYLNGKSLRSAGSAENISLKSRAPVSPLSLHNIGQVLLITSICGETGC